MIKRVLLIDQFLRLRKLDLRLVRFSIERFRFSPHNQIANPHKTEFISVPEGFFSASRMEMAGMLSRSSNKPVPGGGNRGPSPPEAFGGGGGGGGRGDGDGLHGFRQQLQRYRLGLLFTVASIVMLFISFTTLFVARRGAGKFDPLTGAFQSDWIPVSLPMKILLINTAVLIAVASWSRLRGERARLEAVLVPMSKHSRRARNSPDLAVVGLGDGPGGLRLSLRTVSRMAAAAYLNGTF